MVKPPGHIIFNILRVLIDHLRMSCVTLQTRKGGRGMSGINMKKHSVDKQSMWLVFNIFLRDKCLGTTS